jgi:integrase
MSVYRKKKNGKPYGPWIIQYPHRKDPITGKTIYTTKTAGYSKRTANRTLTQKLIEWDKRKMLGQTTTRINPTLGEILAWFIELPSTQANKTYRKDVQHTKLVNKELGKVKLTSLGPQTIEAFQQKMLATISHFGRPYSPGSVNSFVKLIRKALIKAVKNGLINNNPIAGVTMLPNNSEKGRAINPQEFTKLLSHLPEWLHGPALISYHTGMRKGEILNLTWRHVDHSPGFIKLESENTKTGKGRKVPLSEYLISIIEANRNESSGPDDFVFLRDGEQIKRTWWFFNRATKEAGLEGLRFHDLRHSFVTNARRAGIDRKRIKSISGHISDRVFDQYNHVYEEDILDAAQHISNFLADQGCEVEEKPGSPGRKDDEKLP